MAGDEKWQDLELDEQQLRELLDTPFECENAEKQRRDDCVGFDERLGSAWIYPRNMPLRSYQQSITQAALFKNTLVVLPTGLGKTFIAAVVMYNIYRWYPKGKVVFMAPTRPLVAQQIEACRSIMHLPAKDTVELTGKLPKAKRIELWRNKRVFFVTPQALQSDIEGTDGDTFPYTSIKLLVVDEAHKAKGRYAYAKVAQCINARNRNFRVLALSATPGRTINDVVDVCRNLLISHLEVRCENAADVVAYTHKRNMRTIVVPLSAFMQSVHERLLRIVDRYTRQLVEAGVLSAGALANLSRNALVMEQKRFQERSSREAHRDASTISKNFATSVCLYHGLELLERHGTRVFLNNFEADDEGRVKFVLRFDRELRELVDEVRSTVGPNPFDVSTHTMPNGEIAPIPKDLDFGHPKFEQARTCLLQHFQANPDSRAIVFCEYRESVTLIRRLLLQHTPMLRPRCFVGQGGTTGSIRALSQKQQIQIMADFRSGKSNVLIATCIAEEGIDVGEVELIVCFDITTSNPTRFIQRIGRTGRKKNGNVVMLVTEGREERLLKDVLNNKDQTNKRILNSTIVRKSLYQDSPRLVPDKFKPECVQLLMEPIEAEDEETAKPCVMPKTTTKRAVKKAEKAINAVKGSQDLRRFFQRRMPNPDDDDGERNVFEVGADVPEAVAIEEPVQRSITVDSRDENVGDASVVSCAGRLRKLNRLLQSKKPLLSEKVRACRDMLELLKSTTVSKQAKRFALKKNATFAAEVFKQMQVLQSIESEGGNMSAEEIRIRECYQAIKEIFENEADFERFRNAVDVDSYESKLNTEHLNELESIKLRRFNDEVAKATSLVFQGLDEQGFCWSNFDLVCENLQTISCSKKCSQTSKVQGYVESMVYSGFADNDFNTKDLFIEESKYESQLPPQTQLPEKEDRKQENETNHSLENWMELENYIQEHQNNSIDCVSEVDNLDNPGETPNANINYFGFVRAQECVRKPMQSSTPLATNRTKECRQRRVSMSTVFSQDRLVEDEDQLLAVAEATEERNRPSNLTPAKAKSFAVARTDGRPEELLKEALDTDLGFNLDDFLEPLPEEKLLSQGNSNPASNSKPELEIKELPKTSSKTVSGNPPLLSCLDGTIKPNMKSPENLQKTKPADSGKSPSIFDLHHRKNPALQKIVPRKNGSKLACKRKLIESDSDDEEQPIAGRSPVKKVSLPICRSVSVVAAKSPDLFRDSQSPQIAALPPKRVSINSKVTHVSKLMSLPTMGNLVSPQTPKSVPRSELIGKSPSIFDLHARSQAFNARLQVEESLVDDATILPRRTKAKRKMLDSDSEDEMTHPQHMDQMSEKENVPKCTSELSHASQTSDAQSPLVQGPKRKRRRLNPFIEYEAALSGEDDSEVDETIGTNQRDSIVVTSDDNVEDDAERSHVQVLYLQAYKSPHVRQGFKIPEKRIYNDEDVIFSQPVGLTQPSQYIPDSFVVEEDEEDEDEEEERPQRLTNHSGVAQEETLCPLERAERILKERRRNKRRLRTSDNGAAPRRKKLRRARLLSSSDDET